MSKLFFSLFCGLLPLFSNAQTIVKTLQHGGIARNYRVYIPANYNPVQATPLVLNLHGYTSNSWQQELYGDFRSIADTAGFIIAHPDGTTDGSNNQFWNVGFFPSTIDDVGFLSALIDTLSATYNINPNRIYSTGMSNGGFMSYVLACQTSRIAAIASVTGSMTPQTETNCQPTKPIPVMEIHGTADATVPYIGSNISLPIGDVINYWVSFNHCNPTPTMTTLPNTNLLDGATAEHYVYSGGDNGTTVEHYKVINGGHTWPGASINVGVTCLDFSASKEIWRFFSQYSLNTALTESKPSVFSISPNPASSSLTIHMKELMDAEALIMDLQGKILVRKHITNQSLSLPIHDIPSGIYMLHIRTTNGIYQQKWMKE